MFKVNDYVMYGMTGACKITDIENDPRGIDENLCYVLHPVFNDNMTIRIPMRSESLMRPILTKDEVLALIASMPEKEPFLLTDERQRSNAMKAALKTGNQEDWVKIIKTLYQEKEAKAASNKNLCKSDEDIMNAAEKQLHEEFALALGVSPAEVLPIILEQLSPSDQND